MSSRTNALAAALALAPAAPSAAQLALAPAVPILTIAAGVSQYDLAGTGTAPHGAIRYARPLGRLLSLEVGAGYTRYEPDGGAEAVNLVTPEVQLQAQLAGRRIAPYLGAGGGVAASWISDAFESEVTLSAAAGVRAAIARNAALAGELRVRGIGNGFEGAAAEWTLALALRR